MATEIERKFLVIGDSWRSQATGTPYRQGYLVAEPGRTVRVRIAGDRGFITIKGKTEQISRPEFEYPIPLNDASELLETLCLRPLIEKTRYRLEREGVLWEIDEFRGDNQGLLLAEVELTDPNQVLNLPDWIGEDVSHDSRYYNANLIKYPYAQWGNQ